MVGSRGGRVVIRMIGEPFVYFLFLILFCFGLVGLVWFGLFIYSFIHLFISLFPKSFISFLSRPLLFCASMKGTIISGGNDPILIQIAHILDDEEKRVKFHVCVTNQTPFDIPCVRVGFVTSENLQEEDWFVFSRFVFCFLFFVFCFLFFVLFASAFVFRGIFGSLSLFCYVMFCFVLFCFVL